MNSYNIFKFLGQADSALRRSLGVTRQQRALLRDSDSLKNRFGCANRLDSLSRPCDTICVQDKSSSMKGTDCRPSRIEASKRTTQQYIRRKAELSPQDQIAIVSFTVYAEIVLGLTHIGETDADGTHYWFFRDTDSLVAHYDNLATGIVFRDHDK
jgi:hypothetical protein